MKMINLKKITAAVLGFAVLALTATGCGDEESSSSSKVTEPVEVADDAVLNYTAPEIGEEIVVMTIKGYGDVKFKLFPELCPKGVENFVGLVNKGYYDGVIFHRVIENFMIQGGDPEGTGRGGKTLWGEKANFGLTKGLYHFTGALSYCNSGSLDSSGSQFFVVSGPTSYTGDEAAKYVQLYSQYGIMNVPQEAAENYKKHGGAWHCDGLGGQYSLFGQVFDGLDIIEEVSKVKTDENDRPLEEVVIEKAKVEKYNGEAVKFYIEDYK